VIRIIEVAWIVKPSIKEEDLVSGLLLDDQPGSNRYLKLSMLVIDGL
jgi:hypothetical protein